MTKQTYVVNGKSYGVEIGEMSGSNVKVVVDGVSFDVVVPDAAVKPSAPAPVAKPAPAAAKPAPAPAPAPAAPAAPAPAVGTGSGNEIVAPMPGTVLDVHVKVGDKVTAGQEVVSLEAMKMRNAIRAARDGVVTSVEVMAGQKVAYNAVMVRIE